MKESTGSNAGDPPFRPGDTTLPTGKLSTEVEFKATPFVPRSPSPSPEGTIGDAIEPPDYLDEQHHTWRTLFERQDKMLEGRACPEYIEGRRVLGLSRDRIPRLADASRALEKATGWRIIRVEGYVPEHLFFRLLANRCFPCTDFIRHPSELEYTPAPDMFHDLMGHLPMLTNPRFAAFAYDYGMCGVNARSNDDIAELGRIYWYTVEFGLINPTAHDKSRNDAKSRIYGAGISSSVGEIMHSLSEQVKKHPFTPERLAAQVFDIHHMQEFLFEISSFEELEREFRRWARARGLLMTGAA